LALLLALASSVPPVLGWWRARGTGLVYSGVPLLNGTDFGWYLHYLAVAGRGSLTFANPFLSDAGAPVFNIAWLTIGLLGRMLGTSPVMTFHLARVLLIALTAMAAIYAARLVLRDRTEQRVAVALMLFGSGLGGWVAMRWGLMAPLSPDVDMAEFTLMGSALTSPHLLASWMCALIVIPTALRGMGSGSWRDAVVVAVGSAIWFQFHPYYAPMVWAVITTAVILHGARLGWRVVPWRPIAVMIVGGVPSVLYHVPLVIGSNREWMLDANTLPARQPVLLAVALFGFLVAAPRGYRLLAARSGGHSEGLVAPWLLVAWATTQSALTFLPLGFERRLLQALIVPLALLATPAVVGWWRASTSSPWQQRARWCVAVGMFGSGTALLTGWSIRDVWTPRPSSTFLPADFATILSWSRTHLHPDDLVLARARPAHFLAGWGGTKVYVAEHWTQSRTERVRSAEVEALYREPEAKAVLAFLRAHDVEVVFMGPTERALKGAVEALPNLELLVRSGEYALWRVIR
jgi:hypothetical protein